MSEHLSQDFWRGRKVWLSGHTGFKGSWLAFWLLHWGAIVEGYSLDPDPLEELSLFEKLNIGNEFVKDVRADVANAKLLGDRIQDFQPEIVFHLAAQPLVKRSYLEPLKTWESNVIGTCNVLEALRTLKGKCVAVFITTDKVYDNFSWDFGYRETDPLGGHDPYSSSKAAAELAISSWRSSFCGEKTHQSSKLLIASARAGNVIGGGDWSTDRIVPDAVRSLAGNQSIPVRSPSSTRPWQHVLEPLSGYMTLAEQLFSNPSLAKAFNFGPDHSANRTVKELVNEILLNWPGSWLDQSQSDINQVHEASRLDLATDRAFHQLGWSSRWSFEVTISETINWYRRFYSGDSASSLCLEQIERYLES